MSRVVLGLLTIAFAAFLGAGPAAAGCCGWSQSWSSWTGWGTGCCYQPPVAVAVAPVVVNVAQPVVVVKPVVYPSIWVNQGPVYSGPGPNFAPDVYYPPVAVGNYPYVSGACGYNPCGATAYYAPAPVAYRPVRRALRPIRVRN